LLIFQSRWSYCPKCEKKSWILEVNGKWYCHKKGHLFQAAGSVDGEMPAKPVGDLKLETGR